MMEKTSIALKDFFMYIIPGSMWIISIYLTIIAFNINQNLHLNYYNETNFISFTYNNNNYLIKDSYFLIAVLVIGYIWGIVIAQLLANKNASKLYNLLPTKNKLDHKNNILNNIESDFLSVDGKNIKYRLLSHYLKQINISASWERSMELAMFVKHSTIPMMLMIFCLCKMLSGLILIALIPTVIYAILAIYRFQHYISNYEEDIITSYTAMKVVKKAN